MKRGLLLGSCLVLGTAGLSFAGPLKPAEVSAGAKWVFHVDVEGAINSELGAAIIEEARARGDADQKLAAMQATFGFDPVKDVKSLTVWGDKFQPGSGVAVVRAKLDKDKLLNLARLNAGYAESTHGQHKLYSWTDRNDHANPQRCGAFVGTDLLVIGGSAADVTAALDVLDGASPAAKATDPLLTLATASNGAHVQAAAIDFAMPAEAGPQAAAFQQVESGSMEMGQFNGHAFINLKLTYKTEADAQNLVAMAQGMIAMVKMQRDPQTQQPRYPEAVELANLTQINANGKTVTLGSSYPTAKVIEAMKKHWQKKTPAPATAPAR